MYCEKNLTLSNLGGTNDGFSSKVLPVPIILGLEPPGAVQALLKAVRETTGGK